MDYDAEWAQELEVLESILTPEELEKSAEDTVIIQVKPVEAAHESLSLSLTVKRTPTYPDEAPEVSIRPNAVPEEEITEETIQLSDEDVSDLQVKVEEEAQANLGMAMCFQLQSVLSEQVSVLLVQKAMQAENERAQRQAEEEEAEAARTRGTPVTPETFAAWRTGFLKDMRAARKVQLEEALKALNIKEREERKKWDSRLTGKELWEGADTSKLDAGADDEAGDVDFDQYLKEDRGKGVESDDEDEDGVVLSDSD